MKLASADPEKLIKQIFDEYFHHLLLSALRYVNDYSQAEDIVQDVFVKLWLNIDELKQVNDLKAYLFKAVKNSSLNFLRHLKVIKEFAADFEFSGSSTEKSPEEKMSDEEIKRRVHQAVNKLPDTWKEAFVLSKYEHLKYHEIASAMHISQKTVEKYISKALQFLRLELKDLLLSGISILILLLKK